MLPVVRPLWKGLYLVRECREGEVWVFLPGLSRCNIINMTLTTMVPSFFVHSRVYHLALGVILRLTTLIVGFVGVAVIAGIGGVLTSVNYVQSDAGDEESRRLAIHFIR